MQITYQSRHGIRFATIPQLLGHEFGTWIDGQTRDVPDDLKIMAKIEKVDPNTGRSRSIRAELPATDLIFAAGPDFRSTAIPDPSGTFSGLHPDYVCATCGRETLDLFFRVIAPNGDFVRREYVDENGARLCPRDYLLANRDDAGAWAVHAAAEQSLGHDEASVVLAQESAAAAEAAVAPAPPAPARAARVESPAAVATVAADPAKES